MAGMPGCGAHSPRWSASKPVRPCLSSPVQVLSWPTLASSLSLISHIRSVSQSCWLHLQMASDHTSHHLLCFYSGPSQSPRLDYCRSACFHPFLIISCAPPLLETLRCLRIFQYESCIPCNILHALVTWPCTISASSSTTLPHILYSGHALQPSHGLQQLGLLLPQGLCICCSFCLNCFSFRYPHSSPPSSRSPCKGHLLCEVFPDHSVLDCNPPPLPHPPLSSLCSFPALF